MSSFIKMFFSLIGVGLFFYSLFYTICFCIFDSDILLGLCVKFGKSICKYFLFLILHYVFLNYISATLRGKVVFITGASSGIGEHLAIALAKHGVKLVLAARREQELERVKEKCVGILISNYYIIIILNLTFF